MAIKTKEFRQIIKEETEKLAAENSWDWSNEAQRGYAFQSWIANMICDYEQSFDTDVDEAQLTSRDLKADLVFDDINNSYLLICQCKYVDG